jgi:hypothetical protein
MDCWKWHGDCARLEVERLLRVNQRQADGWLETHRLLTAARDEVVELRRRLGEVGA